MTAPPDAPRFQFGIVDVLLTMAALGVWLTLAALIDSPDVSSALVLIVLMSITCAVYSLIRGRRHAWAIASLLAPIIAGVCLLAALFFANG